MNRVKKQMAFLAMMLLFLPGLSEGETLRILSFFPGGSHSKQAKLADSLLADFGEEAGLEVMYSSDTNDLTDEVLATIDVLFANNCLRWQVPEAAAGAVKRFINEGGGHVALHTSVANHNKWPWYQRMTGGSNYHHPEKQEAELNIVQEHVDHPILEGVDETFVLFDEWFDLDPDPSKDSTFAILITVDEDTYEGGRMGDFHPAVWCGEFDGGRTISLINGHKEGVYSDSNFVRLIRNAVLWVAEAETGVLPPESMDDSGPGGRLPNARRYITSLKACRRRAQGEVFRLNGAKSKVKTCPGVIIRSNASEN